MNPLAGRSMRYLIGADADKVTIQPESITVLPYDYEKPIRNPDYAAGYCNLFWQKDAPDAAPYLKSTDTAKDYGERVIDPKGAGWEKNLRWQFGRWKKLGAIYVELDNADAYTLQDVIGAIELASTFDLKVFAKNPILMGSGAIRYLAHPNIFGAIVEKDNDINATHLDALRRNAGKPDIPVWFVAFEAGERWAKRQADLINQHDYRNMGVSYSPRGEYSTVEHILRPKP